MMRIIAGTLGVALLCAATASGQGITKYVRYAHDGAESYGILDGETIRELRGDIFQSAEPTGRTVPLADARLLVPVEPSKIVAVGFNYRSHLGEALQPTPIRDCSSSTPRRSSPPVTRSSFRRAPAMCTTRGRWSS